MWEKWINFKDGAITIKWKRNIATIIVDPSNGNIAGEKGRTNWTTHEIKPKQRKFSCRIIKPKIKGNINLNE